MNFTGLRIRLAIAGLAMAAGWYAAHRQSSAPWQVELACLQLPFWSDAKPVVSIDQPKILCMALALALCGWLVSSAGAAIRSNRLGLALRALALGLLAFALAAPQLERLAPTVELAVLIDRAADLAPDDPRLVAIDEALSTWQSQPDRTLAVHHLVYDDHDVARIDNGTLAQHVRASTVAASDHVGALEVAAATLDARHRRKLLWLSPQPNEPARDDDLRQQLFEIQRQGIAVGHWTIQPAYDDLRLQRLDYGPSVRVGQRENARLELMADRAGQVTLSVMLNGQSVALANDGRMAVVPGINLIPLDLTASQRGPVVLRASVVTDQPSADRWPQNNSISAVAWATSPPRVVIVTPSEGGHSVLHRALVAGQLDVTTLAAANFNRADLILSSYDLVVLADVAARAITINRQQDLHDFVQAGGGLLMLGSQQAFGLGAWQHSAVEQVLPVTWRGEIEREEPALALVLVIDRSGSMANQDKLELVKEAARLTSATLARNDLIGVIAFDSSPQVIVSLQPAASRLRIAAAIGRLTPGGGTDVLPALREAYVALRAALAKVKHVIVLSDGQSPRAGVDALMTAMRDAAITVSAVGVGTGAGQDLLAYLAQQGSGRFYFSQDGSDVPQIFTQETRQLARRSAQEAPRRILPTVAHAATRGIAWSQAPPLSSVLPLRAKSQTQTLLLTDRQEPLLTIGRFGLGRSAAFASDSQGPWATAWPQWRDTPRFWHQLARSIMRQENAWEPVSVRINPADTRDRYDVWVDAHHLELADDVEASIAVHQQSSAVFDANTMAELPLKRVAPGLWHTTVDVPLANAALVIATIKETMANPSPSLPARGAAMLPQSSRTVAQGVGQIVNFVGAHVTNLHATNLSEPVDHRDVLDERSDQASMIQWLAQPAPVPSQPTRMPLWHWILFCGVLPCWLLEIAWRRLR